jgi:RNA polymerase sigma-70 factor (ECF subfamily)
MTQIEESSSSDLQTQMSLIKKAQANEPVAWEVVFRLYAPLIKRWARGSGIRCPHEIENICQEVFTRIVKNLRSFQKRKKNGSFRGWLRVITRNYIFTNYADSSKLLTIGGPEWNQRLNQIPFDDRPSLLDSATDEHPDEASLLFQQIMAWVDSEYTPVQRSAFKGVVIDQRPAREVADDLRVSVNQIYQNKSRILARIREVFHELV